MFSVSKPHTSLKQYTLTARPEHPLHFILVYRATSTTYAVIFFLVHAKTYFLGQPSIFL